MNLTQVWMPFFDRTRRYIRQQRLHWEMAADLQQASGAIFQPLASAVVLIIALSVAPARGDENLDGLLAKIGRLENEYEQRYLEALAREPDKAGGYRMCAEPVYNAGKRELAIALLTLGEQKADKPAEVRATLRAIYRYELDLERLEASYAQELDQAIEARREHLPAAVLKDPVMVERLRPKYLEIYKKMADYKGLFELLRGMCKDPAVREQLLRTRVAAIASDESTAGELLHLLATQHQWELLSEGGPDLPVPVREHLHYPCTKAQALLELGKKDLALAATDEAAKQLATSSRWTWQQVGEMYFKLGKIPEALKVVRTYAPQGSHLTAQALAKYGDPEGAEASVQQCLDRDAPAWVLFQCVDACRQAGLKKRAEEVFDAAEAKCFKEVARSQSPAFSLPYEIVYRYEQEGRRVRLIDKFAKEFPDRRKDIVQMVTNECHQLAISGKHEEATALAERYGIDRPGKPGAGRPDLIPPAAKQSPPVGSTPPATVSAGSPSGGSESVAKLEELVKDSPKEGAIHVRLGLALVKAGKVEEGRQEVRKGVELGCDVEMLPRFHELPSDCVTIRTNLASYDRVVSAYLQAGLRAELEKDFELLLSQTNAHKVAHLELVARYLVKNDRPAEAEAIYLQIKSLNPYRAKWRQ